MKSLTTLLIILYSFSINAKRVAPAEIKPVKFNDYKISSYFSRTTSGFSVYLVARKKGKKDYAWKTQLFSRFYNLKLETDVQDIHLRSLSLEGKRLIAVDEKSMTYEVNALNGALFIPLKTIIYPSF